MASNQLVDDVRPLLADLQVGLTNLHAQISSLKVDAADASALQEIGHRITGLIGRAQEGDALIQAAAPEAEPDVPTETPAPAPMETPETPAKPPKPRAKSASDSED